MRWRFGLRRALLAVVGTGVLTFRAAAEPGWFVPVIEPDPATGLPARMHAADAGPANLLTGQVRLVLREEGKEIPAPALVPAGAGVFHGESAARKLQMELRYGTDGLAFMEIRLSSTADKPRLLECSLTLTLPPVVDRAFFPAGEDSHVSLIPGQPPLFYNYALPGVETAMPLGQVYSAGENWGLAFFGEFGALIEPFATTLTHTARETQVQVTMSLRCPTAGTAKGRLYFSVTRGDWRPALGAVLARFPDVFKPRNPAVAALQGPFVCSSGTPPDQDIEAWFAQGCRVVEIHGTAPFYGEYVPSQEVWTAFCDDQWHSLKTRFAPGQRPGDGATWQEIRAFVEKQVPPSLTTAKVNDYIDRLHRHGMKGLIYFNPTEAWAPWAAAEFGTDRSLTADGSPIPAWYESSAMIPDKTRSWGKYLLDQLRGELRIYPQVDGVFFDQAAGGEHDLTELCAEGCRIVRAKGGICWWNGPYNLELAALADGMMTEGGGTEDYRQRTQIIQYYGLAGKPIVSLGPASASAYAELLIRGIMPQPVGVGNRELAERWFPLFRWLRNRQWVLDAHALETTPGVAANLYRAPDGNLVIPLVPDPLPAETGTGAPLFNVGITVRVPDAAAVRGVYLLAPDLLGYHKLAYSRDGEALRLTVPRLGPAALVVLAKGGVFPALAGPLHLVRDQPGKVVCVLDNWTAETRNVVLRLESSLGKAESTTTLGPGGSATVEMTAALPAEYAAQRLPLTLSTSGAGPEAAGGNAELWVDAPLLLFAKAPSEMREDETGAVSVLLLTHVANATQAQVEAGAGGCRFEPAVLSVSLKPETAVTTELGFRAVSAGRTTIRVRATAAGVTAAIATLPLEIMATAVTPDGLTKIHAAELILDVFGVDGGVYAHKPVSVNEIEIGDLPQGSGDAWVSGKTMPLTPAAVQALAAHSEIRIENTVGDAFKVRNLRLLVHLRGGIAAVSSVDRGVYTGSTGWLYGEGTAFAAGQPLTGMAIDIAVDPNRHDRYEEFFGTPKSGRLVLEANGADAGQYAHKPVTVNGCGLGDLPAAGDWQEVSMPLTPEALAALLEQNTVEIANSEPPDAFKVRRARLEIVNSAGMKLVTDTDPGAHTSVGWEFAEGTVGSPIRITLTFRRP